MYVNDIQVGTTALDGEPEVVNETSATALVEGNNLLGPVNILLKSTVFGIAEWFSVECGKS